MQTLVNPLKARSKNAYQAAPGVLSLRIVFVNVTIVTDVDDEKKEWILVDTGLKGFANKIKRVAEEFVGHNRPPKAIILTHGHFDHVGSLKKLLEEWEDVPVYAHRLEMPYLTGKSSYPPQDPTVDSGLMALLSRVYPTKPIDISGRLWPLPADGTVPFMQGWQWVHTPGHSPGHISLFRESDRTLISGDAFVTTKQESAYAVLTQNEEVHGPPAYFTIDWQAAEDSVMKLEKLRADNVASGHGLPMHGSQMRKQLRMLAHHFDELALPKHGRYIKHPAKADEGGITDVPPSVMDPLPRVMAGVGLMSLAATAAYLVVKRRQNGSNASANTSEEKPEKRTATKRKSTAATSKNGSTAKTKKKATASKAMASKNTAGATKAKTTKSSTAKKSGRKTK